MDRQQALRAIDRVIGQGPYHATWDSLAAYRPPKWYQELKLGIFIHWGVYSVPAFGNEWYSRSMYVQGTPEFAHHVVTYGPQKDFGYKDFIPLFTAPRFNAEQWAELFADAGAQYVVPVAEHHDGFQMYKSDLSHWNAVEMGPKRDVLGEVHAACQKRGLLAGASSHRVEHWFFMGPGQEFDSDVREPMQAGDFYWPAQKIEDISDVCSEPTPTQEFLEDWLLRCCELVDRYQPRIVYFDWWIQHESVRPYLQRFAAYYYNRAESWGGAVINYKHDAFAFGTAVPDVERGQLAEAKPYLWQSDTAIAKNSWCYTENNDFKRPEVILCDLVDIVSKNGRLLLNVGPKADGSISSEDEHVLRQIGAWMRQNGEAIYGSSVWRVSQEGPTRIEEGQFTDGKDKVFTREDFRFTCRGGAIYVFAMGCKEAGPLLVRAMAKGASFSGLITDVTALASGQPVRWEQSAEGLIIHAEGPGSDAPVVFRVSVK